MSELELPEAPQKGGLVVGVVKRIERYGAYMDLVEYPGWEAFVHISEISLKWVRNIRDYLREGQREVFKVLRVNPDAKQADVSLRRVEQKERTWKIIAWKRRQKVLRILHILAERTGRGEDEITEMVAGPARERGLELYDVFVDVVESGRLPEWMRLDSDVAEKLVQLVQQEIKLRKVAINATLILSSKAGNGVEVIRKAVAEGLKAAGKGEHVSITTMGPPRYLLRVEAEEQARAKELLEQVAKRCIESIERAGGRGELVR